LKSHREFEATHKYEAGKLVDVAVVFCLHKSLISFPPRTKPR